MSDETVSPIWVERVIEKHHGPAAEVEAHLRALGLPENEVAAALRAWAERHDVDLGTPPGGAAER
jgi:hypothetical protein